MRIILLLIFYIPLCFSQNFIIEGKGVRALKDGLPVILKAKSPVKFVEIKNNWAIIKDKDSTYEISIESFINKLKSNKIRDDIPTNNTESMKNSFKVMSKNNIIIRANNKKNISVSKLMPGQIIKIVNKKSDWGKSFKIFDQDGKALYDDEIFTTSKKNLSEGVNIVKNEKTPLELVNNDYIKILSEILTNIEEIKKEIIVNGCSIKNLEGKIEELKIIQRGANEDALEDTIKPNFDEFISAKEKKNGAALVDQIRGIVIHHTTGERKQTPRQVQTEHKEKKDWADAGYHFFIKDNGDVYEGRPLTVQGAHAGVSSSASQVNQETIGIALIGNFSPYTPDTDVLTGNKRGYKPGKGKVSAAMTTALTALIIKLKRNFKNIKYVKPHGGNNKSLKVNKTLCPGDLIIPIVIEIRKKFKLDLANDKIIAERKKYKEKYEK